MKSCLHCGADLPEQAAFCPYCAQSVNSRTSVRPPRRVPRRLLWGIAVLILLAALTLCGWWYSRPKVCDNGTAEVIYQDGGSAYQICIAWANEPFTPFDDRYSTVELDFDYRYPVLLYVNHVESDTHAGETFLQKVDRVTAEFAGVPEALHISCTDPAPQTEYTPMRPVSPM